MRSQISERELEQLTSDMDDMHHDLMPAMHERAAEWAELDRELRRASRASPVT